MDLKATRIIVVAVLVLIVLSLTLKPYFQRREAIQTVNKELSLLKNDDLTFAFNYWQDPKKCPPIYGLLSYRITAKSFRAEKGESKASITVIMNFKPDNMLPSGKEWVFELVRTDVGWQIVSLAISPE